MEPFYLFTDMESFKKQELANFESMRSWQKIFIQIQNYLVFV